MMKSFFKKLAFVMALAMVVSLAAPAGTALAANPLRVVDQDTNKVLKELTLAKVGDSQDLKYWDYFGDTPWNKVPNIWESSDENVFTVDNVGLVTAVGEGEATLTITVGDYVGSIPVFVGEKVVTVAPTATAAPTVAPTATEAPTATPTATPEPTATATPSPSPVPTEVPLSYDVVFKTQNTVSLVFNKDVDFSSSDIKLEKVWNEGKTFNWPFGSFSCKDNVVTFSTYVDFVDGEEYVVTVGDMEATPFKVAIGGITKIELSWKSYGNGAEAPVAYAPLDEDDNEIPVTISYKLWAGDVEVTNAKQYKGGVIEYELAYENDLVDLDENILMFDSVAAGFAAVVPTFIYEVDGEDVEVTGDVTEIVAFPVNPFGIEEFVEWTIVKGTEDKINWSKPRHSFPAFDDEKTTHTLVVLIKDSLGNYYAFPDDYAGYGKYNNKDVLAFDKIGDTDDDAETFEIEFASTNLNTLFVGPNDGSITTIDEDVKTTVLVSVYGEDEEDEEYLVALTDIKVAIDDARYIDDLKVTFDSKTVLPYVAFDEACRQGKATFEVVDQYGDPIDAPKGITLTTDYKSKYKFSLAKTTATPVAGKTGVFEYVFDAEDMYYQKTKEINGVDTIIFLPASGNVTYTAALNDNNKIKDDFTVKIGMPEFVKGATEEIAANIEIEEHTVTATKTLEQKLANSDKGTAVKGDIKVFRMSNGLKVGYETDAKLLTNTDTVYFDKDVKGFEIEKAVKEGETVAVGDVYVVVYDHAGKVMNAASGEGMGVAGSAGQYTVTVTTTEAKTGAASGSAVTAMKYDETGTYTVKVYTVTKVDGDDVKYDTATETFVVNNNNPKITAVEQKVVDLTKDEDGDSLGDLTMTEILKKAFDFKLDGAALKEDNIVFVYNEDSYKYNEDSGSLFIYDVTIYVPLNNKDDEVSFLSNKVSIRKYVEINGLDAE